MNEKENNDEKIYSDKDIDSINELGQINKIHDSTGILPISIIGEIEGHIELGAGRKATKYEHIIPLIIEAEENDNIKGVLLILNTMGGDVEAGLAISELIAGMSKPSVSLVLGGGHSIGVPLAVCTDFSYIAPTAMMTIHPIRTNGLVLGVSQSFEYFKRMQERIINFIVGHSSVKKKTLTQLMLKTDDLANDVGSVVIGKDAVEIGLIDDVGGVSTALARLKKMIKSA